ncbi:MAG: CsbD family protein [Pirellulales bacterium]
MVNQQVLTGNWNVIKGKLKEKWAKLADDDLQGFQGNVDQLVGHIQRKTGESRAAIESFVEEVAEQSSGATAHLRDMVQEGASSAAESARQGYEALRQRVGDAEKTIQERPGQSMAVAFGLGIAAGLGLALLFRERSAESTMARGRGAAEQFGRQMLDALSNLMPQR